MNGKDLLNSIRKIDNDLVKESEDYRMEEKMISDAQRRVSLKGCIALAGSVAAVACMVLLITSLITNDNKDVDTGVTPNAVVNDTSDNSVNRKPAVTPEEARVIRREIVEKTGNALRDEAASLVLDSEYKKEVYEVIEQVLDMCSKPDEKHLGRLVKSSMPDIYNDYPKEYAVIAGLGDKAVPYIFCYIAESETNGLDEAFLMECLTAMTKEHVSQDNEGKVEITLSSPSTPKEFTYVLWQKIKDYYTYESDK